MKDNRIEWFLLDEGRTRQFLEQLLEFNKVRDDHAPDTSEIFISYACGDDESDAGRQRGEIVKHLCAKLDEWGYQFALDTRKLHYGDSITTFMQKNSRSGRVLVILSEKYLSSQYCMTELTFAYNHSLEDEDEFLKRVIPMQLDDVDIRKANARAGHADYWRMQADELALNLETNSTFVEEHRSLARMKEWSLKIADILAIINRKRHPVGFAEIMKDDFAAVREMLSRG